MLRKGRPGECAAEDVQCAGVLLLKPRGHPAGKRAQDGVSNYRSHTVPRNHLSPKPKRLLIIKTLNQTEEPRARAARVPHPGLLSPRLWGSGPSAPQLCGCCDSSRGGGPVGILRVLGGGKHRVSPAVGQRLSSLTGCRLEGVGGGSLGWRARPPATAEGQDLLPSTDHSHRRKK